MVVLLRGNDDSSPTLIPVNNNHISANPNLPKI